MKTRGQQQKEEAASRPDVPQQTATVVTYNVQYAWITLYHALFITDRKINQTSCSLADLPNIAVDFNEYFVERKEVLGNTPPFEPVEMSKFVQYVQELLPKTLACVDTLRNGNPEMVPLITEEMLKGYCELQNNLQLPQDPDFGDTANLDPALTEFLARCLVDPFLHSGNTQPLPPTRQPGPAIKWYDDLTEYNWTGKMEDAPGKKPADQKGGNPPKFDVKQRAFQNAAAIPPIGYDLNPRRLLRDEERDRVATDTDIEMHDVGEPWDEFAAAVRRGEAMHLEEKEK